MRCWAVLFAVVAVAGFAGEASGGEKIRLAQTFTMTNCMMTCNAQAGDVPNCLYRARHGADKCRHRDQ